MSQKGWLGVGDEQLYVIAHSRSFGEGKGVGREKGPNNVFNGFVGR